uniref:Uncharacterized protein n=1 Tax=Tanacetum cinerariifolium TaxID=118510 RepID=A0A6L2NRA7_TANCI|nr:hypothetical protein [Tanacetum cinerariifolium]
MAYASNQDDGNAIEIDTQILNAFMEVDPVSNPAVMDVDVEPWDSYFTVDSFRSLTNLHAYYKIEKVRVDFVWLDENNNKLYYFLHDKDVREKKIAVDVPPNLVAEYKDKTFAQTFVSIHNFQVVYSNPTGYPQYQTYSFLRRDWFIAVNSDTVNTENLFAKETGFQMHSWLPSIRCLVGKVSYDESPIRFSRSTKKSISSLSNYQKYTVIHESSDEEFKNYNIIDDYTNEQDDVALENTKKFTDDEVRNDEVRNDEVGIDIQHSESVSDEYMVEEDDLDDFIDDDDAIDEEYTDDDF